MLNRSAITNRANSAYPRFLHLALLVRLLEIVKPVNPDRTPRKLTVSLAYLLPRFSHIVKTVLHAGNAKSEAQVFEPYRKASTSEYPPQSIMVLLRVVLNKFSSSDIRRETNHPPESIAKPKASNVESTYIPILQLLSMVFGFSIFLSNNKLRLWIIAFFIVVALVTLFLCFRVALPSTGISQQILSTVNFTLPYAR